MSQTELDVLKRAGVALRDCIAVFKWLGDHGKYPEPLMQDNGGNGWKFAEDAERELATLVAEKEAHARGDYRALLKAEQDKVWGKKRK